MSTLNLKEALEQKEREFNFTDDIFGMTLLTNPGYISSSRSLMYTSHLRQFVNLVNPDIPRVFTNYENSVGKLSTGYYEAKNDYEVYAKVSRFEDSGLDNHLYLLFIYDKKNDKYDVITKEAVTNLTEKFGYGYKTDIMDSKEVGDAIEKGEVLYRSTSYDDDMNYRFGTNVKVMYALDNHTIEDAIICSESFSKRLISKEIEEVSVSLNDNDLLCNIYGDANEYKAFPDIGENTKDKIICAKRRIHNNQVLYDLKKSNLRKINFMNDNLYYIDGKVIDIVIYSNKTLEELPDNIFNKQIRKYLEMQNKFYTNVYHICKDIIKSGSKYSNDIAYYFKKAKDVLDPDVKWREESSVFSNMIIKFLVERDSALTIGQKISGRQGNKGVISKILPDDQMPYLENGERVEVILNSLGVINRLNPMQIYELSINFICNRVVEKLREFTNLKDKETLFFDIIKRFNDDEEKVLKIYYKNLKTKEKKEFFDDVDTHGIYIHMKPFWEDKESLFDIIRQIYKDYDFIKPADVYINKWGRKIKIMKPLIVGELYMIKLKQSSKKGFSARSTGSLSRRGIPDKSYKNKVHQDLYSSTPIRIGDQENINSLIGVQPEDIAKLHLFYRSSVIGRRDIGKQLATTIKTLKDFKNSDRFTNRNVEILQAYFKAMGLKIEFLDNVYKIDINTDYIKSFNTDTMYMISTKQEYEDTMLKEAIRKKYRDDVCFVGTSEEFNELLESEYKEAKRQQDYYCIDIEI